MNLATANDDGVIHGLVFPSTQVLIAMGPATDAFRTELVAMLVQAGARRTDTPVDHRMSRTGRYQSVHIEVHVETREELEALYAVVKSHPGVVYRL